MIREIQAVQIGVVLLIDVDLFRDVAVVQLNTIGVKLREGVIFDALSAALPLRALDQLALQKQLNAIGEGRDVRGEPGTVAQ